MITQNDVLNIKSAIKVNSRISLFLAIIVLVICVYLAFGNKAELKETIGAKGIVLSARVDRINCNPNRSIRNKGLCTLDLMYRTNVNGVPVQQYARIESATRYAVGDVINILYDENNPENITIYDQSQNQGRAQIISNPWWNISLMIIAGIIFIYASYNLYKSSTL
jgi:hypothetical protein